jgi:hypothetical protein
VNRTVKKELGFMLITSASGEDSVMLHVHCGVYDSPYNNNACVLDLPSRGPITERLVNAPMVERILRLMVDVFEPEDGKAGEFEFWDAMEPDRESRWERTVNWMMYFSRACGTVPPLPAPVRIEPVSDKGMLVILSPEPVVASNPEHLALGRQVRALLKRAGVLDPPPPEDR